MLSLHSDSILHNKIWVHTSILLVQSDKLVTILFVAVPALCKHILIHLLSYLRLFVFTANVWQQSIAIDANFLELSSQPVDRQSLMLTCSTSRIQYPPQTHTSISAHIMIAVTIASLSIESQLTDTHQAPREGATYSQYYEWYTPEPSGNKQGANIT